ncbi:MAG: hypothetical protein ABR612_01790 [Chromatocurvus sp.]
MKKLLTKAELRAQLAQEMEQYLNQGGAISSVDQGVSGRETGAPFRSNTRELFTEPRAERTQIPEVIAALEARRKPPRKAPATARKRQRRKVIYDDFGEPLRHVWTDD